MREIPKRIRTWGLIGVMLMATGLIAISAVGAQTTPVSVQQVVMGQSSSFSGMGFNANEIVSLWMTAPDKSVTALPGNQADGRGVVTVNVSFSTNGFWQVTAHGVNSGRQVIEGFNVGDPAAATAAASAVPTSISGTPAAGAPAGATTVAVNQATTFIHGGFQNNELVSFWTTAPDGKVTALDGASADASGSVTVAVSFPTDGYWQLTAHGLTSGKEIIGGFAVGDLAAAATAAPALSGTVVAPLGTGPITPAPSVSATETAASGTPPVLSSQLSTSTAATVQAALGGQLGNVPSTNAASTYAVGPVPSASAKLAPGS